MAQTSTAVAKRALPDKLGKSPPSGWGAKDLWPFLLEMSDKTSARSWRSPKRARSPERADPGRVVAALLGFDPLSGSSPAHLRAGHHT